MSLSNGDMQVFCFSIILLLSFVMQISRKIEKLVGAVNNSLLYMVHLYFHFGYDFTNMVDYFSLGLLPIIQQMKCGERVLESLETIETLRDHLGKVLLEAFIDGTCYNSFITFDVVILSFHYLL
jgi:hypothetical protein